MVSYILFYAPLASPLSGGSRATTLDLAASPLPPLPPRRHQRHPPGKPGASPRKVAAGPLLLRFSSGGRRNPGRRPRSVRRHRLLGWWWRGCGPVGLAARAASSPADKIHGTGGGASGLFGSGSGRPFPLLLPCVLHPFRSGPGGHGSPVPGAGCGVGGVEP